MHNEKMDGKKVAYGKRLKRTQVKHRVARKTHSHDRVTVDDSTTSSTVSLGESFDSLSSSLPPPLELPAPLCLITRNEVTIEEERMPTREKRARVVTDVPLEIPGFSLGAQRERLSKSMDESSAGITLSIEGSQGCDPGIQRKCAVCGDDCCERCYFTSGKSYHPRCLSCTRCHRHLRPPSCAFMCNLPYCVRCVTAKREPLKCDVCSMPIFDKRDQVIVDWHEGPVHRTCLRCYLCSEELDADGGTLVGGKPLCGSCLETVSERKCSACGKAVVDDAVEIVGVASKFKSKNVGVQMAYNNAVVTYAQRAGSYIKGRVASDISGDGTDAEGEFEHFYAAYEREVEKEIKGELEPSFTVIRDNGDGTYEMQSYFIASESAASKARIRAYENAMKESQAAQKYATKISEFVNEGVPEE